MLVTRNEELNGIEVTFENKPEVNVLSVLKSNGFRWHRVKKIWYAKDTNERMQILEALQGGVVIPTVAPKQKPKENVYGVQVGDVYSFSFGYDATLYVYLQVVELVGTTSVRVVEVYPEKKNHNALNCCAWSYELVDTGRKLLPRDPNSIWIKDDVKGDLKRIKLATYYNNIPCFKVGRHTAYKQELKGVIEEDNYH